MSLLVFILAQGLVVSQIAPEEFRKTASLNQLCLSRTTPLELASLNLEPGSNVANIALKRSGDQPAWFDSGIVSTVRVEKNANSRRMIVSVRGQRNGLPARLRITFPIVNGVGHSPELLLVQGVEQIKFGCVPAPPRQTQ